MYRHVWSSMSAFVVALVMAGVAQAQVFTPTYTSPRLVNEFGVNVSDQPGNVAVEGLWRGGPMGLRVGYADTVDGLFTIGGELRNAIPVAGAPLGLAFTAGAQGMFGDDNAYGLQTGLSAGYTIAGNGVTLTPYLHPRVGLIRDFGVDDFEVRALADAGVDVEFYNNLLVRVGANLSDVGAGWGVGLGWRQ